MRHCWGRSLWHRIVLFWCTIDASCVRHNEIFKMFARKETLQTVVFVFRKPIHHHARDLKTNQDALFTRYLLTSDTDVDASTSLKHHIVGCRLSLHSVCERAHQESSRGRLWGSRFILRWTWLFQSFLAYHKPPSSFIASMKGPRWSRPTVCHSSKCHLHILLGDRLETFLVVADVDLRLTNHKD